MPQQYYLKKLLMTPNLDNHSKTNSKPEIYQLLKLEVEYDVMEEMCVTLGMRTCFEKSTFQAKTT